MISMPVIAHLATLTLAFMAFTASANSDRKNPVLTFFKGRTWGKLLNSIDTIDVLGTYSLSSDRKKLVCGSDDVSDCAYPDVESYREDVHSLGFLPEVSDFYIRCHYWNKTNAKRDNKNCTNPFPDGYVESGNCSVVTFSKEDGISLQCRGYPLSSSTQDPVVCTTATSSKSASTTTLNITASLTEFLNTRLAVLSR